MSEIRLDFQIGKGRHNVRPCHREGAGKKVKSLEDKQRIHTGMKVKFKVKSQKHRDEKLRREGEFDGHRADTRNRLHRSAAKHSWALLPSILNDTSFLIQLV